MTTAVPWAERPAEQQLFDEETGIDFSISEESPLVGKCFASCDGDHRSQVIADWRGDIARCSHAMLIIDALREDWSCVGHRCTRTFNRSIVTHWEKLEERSIKLGSCSDGGPAKLHLRTAVFQRAHDCTSLGAS